MGETMAELKEITEIRPDLDCKLCYRTAQDEDSDIQLGPLYEFGVCRAHHYCLMFSSGLEQNGEEEEGIKGFMPDDIIKEWKRGGYLKCTYCKKKYATVGCISTSCRKCYHLPCGLENNSMQQFFGSFSSFCEDHRPKQETLAEKDKECGVCLETLYMNDTKYENMSTPCCGGWFHRRCVSRMASNAGMHFFKCPLCNNKDEFAEEMMKYGIYVPDQDAKWETEGEAFNDLLQRPDSCDAEVCLCPGGRKVDEVDTKWETSICVCCGAQCIHIECGGLNFDRPRWKCNLCRSIVQTIPKKPVSVFGPVKRNAANDESKSIMDNLLSNMTFKVKAPKKKDGIQPDKIQCTIGSVRITLDSAPAFDIPMPVQVRPSTNKSKRSAKNEGNKENCPNPASGKAKTLANTNDCDTENLLTSENTASTKTDHKKQVQEEPEDQNNTIVSAPETEIKGKRKRDSLPSDPEKVSENKRSKLSAEKPSKQSVDKFQPSVLSFFKLASREVAKPESKPSSPKPRTSTKGGLTEKWIIADGKSPKSRKFPEVTDEVSEPSSEDNIKKLKDTAETGSKKESLEAKQDSQASDSCGVERSSTVSTILSAVQKQITTFICQYCRISFSNLLSWKQHENSHLNGNKCGVCDDRFSTAKQLNKHMQEKHSAAPQTKDDESVYQCPHCEFSSKVLKGLRRHITAKHTYEEEGVQLELKCEECDFVGHSLKEIGIHNVKEHKEEEEHQCMKCPSIYTTHEGLQEHIKKNHVQGSDVYQCSDCPSIFTSHPALVEHFTVKHEEQLDSDSDEDDGEKVSSSDNEDPDWDMVNAETRKKVQLIISEWDE